MGKIEVKDTYSLEEVKDILYDYTEMLKEVIGCTDADEEELETLCNTYVEELETGLDSFEW